MSALKRVLVALAWALWSMACGVSAAFAWLLVATQVLQLMRAGSMILVRTKAAHSWFTAKFGDTA